MDRAPAKAFEDDAQPRPGAEAGLRHSVSIRHQKQPESRETEPSRSQGKTAAQGRSDITIQRKKHTASQVNAGPGRPEARPREEIEPIQEKLNESYDSSSLMEEREDNLQKVHLVKKLDKGSRNVSNLPSALLPGAGASKADYYFNNHKKITSLDEFYVESNYFKRNNGPAYAGPEVDFARDAFAVEVLEARYLPDTSNFLKVRGFFYSGEGQSLTDPQEALAKLDGDANQQFFDLVLKLDRLKNSSCDEVFLFLVWETFQDIFGDDDIEFTPLVFGFSLVKLFEADGLKSLSSTKWTLARGLFQIGVFQPAYLKLSRQELLRRFRKGELKRLPGTTALVRVSAVAKKDLVRFEPGEAPAYQSGEYNTCFLEEYPRENQLIFKLQQRKSSKVRQLAENVVSQLSPDWREALDGGPAAEEQFLRRELARYFKVSRDCRLLEDHTVFRVTADKKVAVQVLALRGLPRRGHFAVCVICISNEVISFNKESRVFAAFDTTSDAFNPLLKEKEIIFNSIDPGDETSFNLLLLLEILPAPAGLAYHICGMNVLPLTTSADTVLNGIFELPLLDLHMCPEVFQELNIINPWQFQYKFLKEKKLKPLSTRVVVRQCNTDLSDMYPSSFEDFMLNKMFVLAADKPAKQEVDRQPEVRVSEVLLPEVAKRDVQFEIREYVKDVLYKE